MPRSKPLLVLTCSLALLARTAIAEPSPASVSATAPGYGIDPGASYPGTMVQALLEAAEDEAGSSIEEAYAEGYKAGLLEAAPDRDYWKSLSEGLQREDARRDLEIFLTGTSVGGVAVTLILLAINIVSR